MKLFVQPFSPDFLPSYVWNRRDPIYEELVHVDMMERRLALDIPEFYVGKKDFYLFSSGSTAI